MGLVSLLPTFLGEFIGKCTVGKYTTHGSLGKGIPRVQLMFSGNPEGLHWKIMEHSTYPSAYEACIHPRWCRRISNTSNQQWEWRTPSGKSNASLDLLHFALSS